MNKNVKIAKELIKLAKILMADDINSLFSFIKEALSESAQYFYKTRKGTTGDNYGGLTYTAQDVAVIGDYPKTFTMKLALRWDTSLMSNEVRANVFADYMTEDFFPNNKSVFNVEEYPESNAEQAKIMKQIFSSEELKRKFEDGFWDDVRVYDVLLYLTVELLSNGNGGFKVQYKAEIGDGAIKYGETSTNVLSRAFSKGEGAILKKSLVDAFKKLKSTDFVQCFKSMN